MTAALALHAPAPLASVDALRAADADAARDLAGKARAPRTVAAYAAAWAAFEAWAAERQEPTLPATGGALAAYVAHLHARGLKPASIDVALAAISRKHKAAGLPSPRRDERVHEVRAGARRDRGTAQKQAHALTPGELRAVVAACDVRDRALLLLGFATALRRSELVALDVGDMRFVDRGLVVFLKRSKTDQEGKGRYIPVHARASALCPVRALRAWLGERREGPLFTSAAGVRLSDRDVARILKRAAARAGLDASALSGHSLRSGFATAAAEGGASRAAICAITGHDVDGLMVERYIRAGEMFAVDPLAGVL